METKLGHSKRVVCGVLSSIEAIWGSWMYFYKVIVLLLEV